MTHCVGIGRIRMVFAASVIGFVAGVIASATAFASGDIEPNDSPAAATDCSDGSGAFLGSLLDPTDSVDYFLLGDATHFAIEVSATLDGAGADSGDDVNFYLEGSLSGVLAMSENLPGGMPQDTIMFTAPKGSGMIYLRVEALAAGWDGASGYVLAFTATTIDTEDPGVRFLGNNKLRKRRTPIKVNCSDDVGVMQCKFRAGSTQKKVAGKGRRDFQARFVYRIPAGKKTPRRVRIRAVVTDQSGKVTIGTRVYKS